jgi:hypothetical protein
MDRVGQTPGRKGARAGRSAMFYVGLASGFEDMCLHMEWKAKAVEKVSGGHSTWLAGHVAWPVGHHLVPN